VPPVFFSDYLANSLQPPSAGSSIDRFAHYLQDRHSAVPGARPHHLTLKAVLLIPSLAYQTSPIATIPPSSFADLFNTHLLHPILTIQAFLPLLTARLGSQSSETNKTPPKVLVFTPSIISSINPPFHAPEATVCSALSAFTEVLTAELRPLSIPVTHIQLGTFDFQGFTPEKNHQTQRVGGNGNGGYGNGYQPGLLMAPAENAETLTWPDSARHAYGRNYVNQSASAIAVGRIRGLRGSSLRSLHNAVFDVIDGSVTSGVVRIGLGSSVYGFVGRWVPRSLVSWMMGIRRVDELASWSSSGSDGNSPRPGSAGSSSGSVGGMDFVSVPVGDLPGGADVWREM
jgi:NAD(P)-dependent dehydrogenase (short-subunit alcohol dehydrogenase family)